MQQDTRLLSNLLDVRSKHLVATVSTTLAVLVLVAGCANSDDDESTSRAVAQDLVTPEAEEPEDESTSTAVAQDAATPVVAGSEDESTRTAVAQDVITPVVAESEQAYERDVFLRVIAPLDEARGYCLDIPGHRSGVRVESGLQAHTCKHGIWNLDGRFDVAAPGSGVLRMPNYDLCLQAENSSIGARLLLADCTEAELQTWTLLDSGEIALESYPQMCVTIAAGPGRDAGGPQYLMKSVGLDTCAPQTSDRQQWTTVIPQ